MVRWVLHVVAGYPFTTAGTVACVVLAGWFGPLPAVAVGGWLCAARLLLARQLPGPVDDWLRAWAFGWRFRRRWLNLTSRCRVQGTDDKPPRIGVPWPVAHGARLRVRPAAGSTLEDLAEQAPALAAQCREVVSIDVEFTSRASTVGTLTARFADPLQQVHTPGDILGVPSDLDPMRQRALSAGLRIGVFADGSPVRFPAWGAHALVSGVTGSGKSGWLATLVGGYAQHPNVVLVGIDPKRVELSLWQQRFTHIATDLQQVEQLLRALRVEVDDRYHQLTARGARKFSQATPDMPLVVLVVDELAELRRLDPNTGEDERAVRRARDHAARRLAHLSSLAAIGRAAGLVIVAATQYPTAEMVPSDLRANLTVRIAGRVSSKEQLGVALGEGLSASVPHDAIRADQPGVAWILGLPETPKPRQARCPMWHDDVITAWSAATARLRPAFDLPSVET